MGRHAQIGQNAVNGLHPIKTQVTGHVAEVFPDKGKARIVDLSGRHFAVLIEGEQTAALPQTGKDFARVSAAAERRIDVHTVGLDRKSIDGLVQKYGYVVTHRRIHISREEPSPSFPADPINLSANSA